MNAQALHSDTQSSVAALLPAQASPSTVPGVTRHRASKFDATTGRGRVREIRSANPLKRLILQRMAELDLTYHDVALRGGFSSHSTVHALVRKDVHRQPPRPETLRRLAKALSVPLDVVRVAAAESAGYRLEEIPTTLEASEDVRIVAVSMGEMTADQRAELRAIAAEMIEQHRADRDDDGDREVSDR